MSWLASQRVARAWWACMALTVLVSVGAVVVLAVHPLKNSVSLANALARERRGDEPVVMVRQYAFDLPFYARLKAPVTIVDDWSSPEVQLDDNWRKEIADAREFAPASGASLIEPAALPGALCSAPVTWVLGETNLGQAQWHTVATEAGTTLWRVEAKVLACPGTPNAGSGGK